MNYDTAVDNVSIEKSTVQDSQGEKKENRCFINSFSKSSHLNHISNIYTFALNEPEKIKGLL